MDKPAEGINVKPPGTQNGPMPLNKAGSGGMMTQEMGSSLPNGPITKVPGAPNSIQNVTNKP